jgi:hypothetical protein
MSLITSFVPKLFELISMLGKLPDAESVQKAFEFIGLLFCSISQIREVLGI